MSLLGSTEFSFLQKVSIMSKPHEGVYKRCGCLGLRRGEVIGLRWCDLDRHTGTITVAQQVRQHGRQLDIGAPKSRASNRTLILDHGR